MKSSSLLYLVRSCPTVLDSKIGKLCPKELDPPLSESGKARASLLAEAITSQEFNAVFSSTKRRAVQTAQILSKDSDSLLRLSSVLSGSTGKHIGESKEQAELKQKIKEWLLMIAAKYQDKRILGVTSEEVMKLALALVCRMPNDAADRLSFDRGDCVVIRIYRGVFQLEAILSNEDYLQLAKRVAEEAEI